jgi:tRNA threonylcarbamoyladenosine biosynthesis protein TsaE
MRQREFTTSSPKETQEIGETLGSTLKGGELITVEGPLGAGKTTFIRGLALGLGIERGVCSPTYTLVNEYRGGRLVLYHVDLYRLGGAADVEGLGLDECLESGVVAVEWPEVGAPFWTGYMPRLDVRLHVLSEEKRRIAVEERR